MDITLDLKIKKENPSLLLCVDKSALKKKKKAIDSEPTLKDESVQLFNLHPYYWGGNLLFCPDGKSIVLNSTTCFCSFLRINAAP